MHYLFFFNGICYFKLDKKHLKKFLFLISNVTLRQKKTPKKLCGARRFTHGSERWTGLALQLPVSVPLGLVFTPFHFLGTGVFSHLIGCVVRDCPYLIFSNFLCVCACVFTHISIYIHHICHIWVCIHISTDIDR